MEEEIWKDVVGYEGYYQVSNLGRVKSLERIVNGATRKQRFLKLSQNGNMLSVCFVTDGKHRSFQVHNIVATAFIPNQNNHKFVKHIDGNPNNNNANNLMWCEMAGNMLTQRSTYEKRKRPIYGVGINDISEYMRGKKVYLVWKSMLARCYSKIFQKGNKTYQPCSVCDDWKKLSCFKDWFDANYKDGFQLDKDLFGDGSKMYSPQTCCFLPQSLNNLLKETKESSKGLPKGVGKQYRLYIARFRHDSVRMRKTFDTIKEAAVAYAVMRSDYVISVAERYFNDGLIDEKVLNAVKKYMLNEIQKAKIYENKCNNIM